MELLQLTKRIKHFFFSLSVASCNISGRLPSGSVVGSAMPQRVHSFVAVTGS